MGASRHVGVFSVQRPQVTEQYPPILPTSACISAELELTKLPQLDRSLQRPARAEQVQLEPKTPLAVHTSAAGRMRRWLGKCYNPVHVTMRRVRCLLDPAREL